MAGVTCDDSAYKIEIDEEGLSMLIPTNLEADAFPVVKSSKHCLLTWSAVALDIFEKLAQRSAIAVIGGRISFPDSGDCFGTETGNSVCIQPTFNISSISVGTIFSNGTKTGFVF